MVWRRSRRSSGATRRALGIAVLLGLACIDLGQIRDPINQGPETDGGPMTDVAPGPDVAPGTVRFGDPCDNNQDCAEGTCVDGVCCRQGSCPVCQACGTDGQCLRVPGGQIEPHFRCHPPDPPESCGLSGACDGMGACAFYPIGVECVKGSCNGDAVVGAHVCNGAGQCRPAPARICVPFRCTAGECERSCTSDAQCVNGQRCVNASCGRLMTGALCQRDDACASNFCADGLCCNVACQGACVACNQAGREGTCWPINANQPDPRGICRDMGPASCGSIGICDGLGECLRYNQTTVCMRTCAADGSALTSAYCDGFGACGPASDVLACPTNTCDASMAACR